MIFKLHYLGYHAIEKAPFEIERLEGSFRYIFFHFISSVKIELNGEIIQAPPGSCILYTPHFRQRFFVDNISLNHDYLDFACEYNDFFQEIRYPTNKIITPKCSSYISKTIENVYKEQNSNKVGSTFLINSIITEMFVSLSRKIHNYTSSSADYTETLIRKFEKIRLDMYHSPGNFKVREMANNLDFSLSHFNLLYKKFFQISPIKDLTQARIEHVKNNILNYKSSYELASDLGFSSIEYFYRWFKTQFNSTPKEYIDNKLMERGYNNETY